MVKVVSATVRRQTTNVKATLQYPLLLTQIPKDEVGDTTGDATTIFCLPKKILTTFILMQISLMLQH
jgi:hypothetical protein